MSRTRCRRTMDEPRPHIGAPGEPGHRNPPGHAHQHITLIAAERLVAAVPSEHHGHVLAAHPRHVEARDRRSVREGLVEVPGQHGQDVRGSRCHDEFLVVGSVEFGQPPRVLLARRTAPSSKPMEKVLTGLRSLPSHRGDHRGRVDAAGQERAERPFAEHPHLGGVEQQRPAAARLPPERTRRGAGCNRAASNG